VDIHRRPLQNKAYFDMMYCVLTMDNLSLILIYPQTVNNL